MLGLLLAAVGVLCLSGLVSVIVSRSDRLCLWTGTAGTLLAGMLGAIGAVRALLSPEDQSIRLSWPLPAGELHIGLDPLSSFFLLCIFTVSGLAAIYGLGYLPAYIGKRRLAPAVVFFNVLVAAMVAVVLARDGILLIVAWEVMSIASFFLVVYEHERADVRRAGFTYLVASQLGVVFLFILFAVLGRAVGSYDFDLFPGGAAARAGVANAAFLLALVGFGTKAGFWPVHLWLPDAHPAAPSHVSALMSGVMIKMGIYGLLRTLLLLGPPPAWWGVVLVAIGAISGVLGVLQALAQHDLKRLLAYHSVENIGIIALGIGIGLLGQSHGLPSVTFLGYAGALLHVLNHGLFKGLLFQGAGSVLHGTGTTNLDSLGGLHRRMPTTSLTFLVGAAAICGLPPLNGFVSEWLIYVGAFRGGAGLPAGWALASLIAVLALALIGGLAAACFVKAYGVVFLGLPRTRAVSSAHEPAVANAAGDDPDLPSLPRDRRVARGGRPARRPCRASPGRPRGRCGRYRWSAGSHHLRGGRHPGMRRTAGDAARPPPAKARGRAGGHLGLRVRHAHGPHAVHRCLLRSARPRALRAGHLLQGRRRGSRGLFPVLGPLRGTRWRHGGRTPRASGLPQGRAPARAGARPAAGPHSTLLSLHPHHADRAPRLATGWLGRAYLLALGRFLTMAAALDTGSSFEGMGASREATFSALAEPTLFLILAILCLPDGSPSFESAWKAVSWAAPGLARAPLLTAAAALFAIILAENSRIPVDDPNTHLELTMIHEVMVLDHSGPDLALILYGAAVKLFIFGSLLVHAVVPFPTDDLWRGVAILLGGQLAVALLIGVVESTMARLRLVRVPQFLIGAFAVAAIGLVAHFYRIGR